MKVVSFLFFLLLAQCVWSQDPAYPSAPPALQNITAAEYFIDTDPGLGNGTSVAITPGTNLSNVPATINTTGLTNGVHRLFLRTRSSGGVWSLTSVTDFLVNYDPPYPIAGAAPQNITAAEYFLDTDPGLGNGTAIPISPATNLSNIGATITTTGLSIGVHRLFLRTRNGEGAWSLTSVRDFLVDADPAYPMAPTAPGNLVFAEYFFDADPGFGKGKPVTFTPTTNLTNYSVGVDVSGLSEGNHTFFIRTLDDWSLTGYQTFFIGTVLPLRLLSFYAKNREQDVWLEWKTDNEQNTARFEVERSADGTRFTKVAVVAAKNQSGTHLYTAIDGQRLTGKTHYRLKLVDNDGKAEYSKTVVVNGSKTPGVEVFPNPASDRLTVMLPLQNSSQTLTLLNPSAQIVKVLPVAAGTTSVDVSLTGLSAGQYFIKWQAGNRVQVTPFVIR